MELNKFAGREEGDPNLHPIYPWVMDFSSSYGGWRDLGKTKFRLNKGDQQLDSTYKVHGVKPSTPSAARSRRSYHEEGEDEDTCPVTSHHLIDTLSEITFYSYLARRMPKNLLCKYVRSKWEPNEYPRSMAHLYKWSPDECIPEFYTDPTVFTSIHSDLPDLELPPWAENAKEFIVKHSQSSRGVPPVPVQMMGIMGSGMYLMTYLADVPLSKYHIFELNSTVVAMPQPQKPLCFSS
eukprot:sb/3469220/